MGNVGIYSAEDGGNCGRGMQPILTMKIQFKTSTITKTLLVNKKHCNQEEWRLREIKRTVKKK